MAKSMTITNILGFTGSMSADEWFACPSGEELYIQLDQNNLKSCMGAITITIEPGEISINSPISGVQINLVTRNSNNVIRNIGTTDSSGRVRISSRITISLTAAQVQASYGTYTLFKMVAGSSNFSSGPQWTVERNFSMPNFSGHIMYAPVNWNSLSAGTDKFLTWYLYNFAEVSPNPSSDSKISAGVPNRAAFGNVSPTGNPNISSTQNSICSGTQLDTAVFQNLQGHTQ